MLRSSQRPRVWTLWGAPSAPWRAEGGDYADEPPNVFYTELNNRFIASGACAAYPNVVASMHGRFCFLFVKIGIIIKLGSNATLKDKLVQIKGV